MSNIQTGAERMPHDLSHLGFLAGQIGRLITISTTPVIAFDFERIEALKPAIEACGISTLSQSPMLGFHKQMDNRIKLLEEILSFRMQGVEFDNGDMYVDGHKA